MLIRIDATKKATKLATAAHTDHCHIWSLLLSWLSAAKWPTIVFVSLYSEYRYMVWCIELSSRVIVQSRRLVILTSTELRSSLPFWLSFHCAFCSPRAPHHALCYFFQPRAEKKAATARAFAPSDCSWNCTKLLKEKMKSENDWLTLLLCTKKMRVKIKWRN